LHYGVKMTINFWIGIVFWCLDQTCGLVTHTVSFPTREECLREVKIMQNKIKVDRHQKPNIVEGRCSPQSVQIESISTTSSKSKKI